MPPDGKAASNGLPPLVSLEEFLATPDEELTYRVDQLWPTGGRVILAAAWKAGKTTLLGNLIRALVDGLAFLGLYAVQPAQRVVLIDDELDARTLRRWLRDQGIVNTQRVELVALRGKVSTFNILDRAICAQWAKHIGPADVLLFDCLRPVLDALNLKEATEAGRFLVAFDELLDEACIPEAGIAHHMGHVGERSRGDSRLRDWPDAEWKLVRGKDKDDDETDPAAPRYFSAYGRDVDQPEQLLGYDPTTRRLTVTGGSRKDAETQAALADVLPLVNEHQDGRSGRQIEDALCGEDGRHTQKAVRAAVKAGRVAGLIKVTPGPRNAHIHHLTPLGAQEITP